MGSKGGKTVILPQAQAQTSTVAPNPVALAAYQNVVGQAQNLQGQHIGFTPDQQRAFGEVNQLQGAANPYIDQAAYSSLQGLNAGNALIQQGANAGSPQNFGYNINSYMSPYLNDVVRATMANINETNAQQQSQLTGNAIAQSAMGGNRVGVAGAELARQQNMTNNSTLANILQSGYAQAGQNLFQNAGLNMQAGNSLGALGNQTAGIYSGLGNEALSTGLQGANALLQTGGMQQALPYQQLGWLSGIVGNQGPNMGQTGTQNSMGYTSQYAPSPNPLNSILGAGVAGAGLLMAKDGGRVTKAHGGGLGEYDPSADDYDSPVGGGFGAIPQVKPTNPHGLQLPAFLAMQQAHQGQQEQGKDPSFGDWGKAGKGLGGAYDRYSDRSAMDSFANDYASKPDLSSYLSEWRGGRVRGYDEGGIVGDDFGPSDNDTINDVDPTYARMIKQESGGKQFDKNGEPLTSPKGAIGVGQVMPNTAPEAATLAGLPYDENRYRYDPEYNKALGAAYYKAQLDRFGDPEKAAAAYNAGPGRVHQALTRADAEGGNWRAYLPQETRGYLANVTGGGLGAINSAAPIAMADSGGLTEGRSADTGVAPPDAEPGFLERLGVPKISPDTRAALISAGLGMMASKSHWLGPAIGEGGLAGVKSYYANQQNTRQNLNTQSEIANRAGMLGVAQQRNRLTGQHLGLTAEQIRQQGEYQRGQLGLGQEHNRLTAEQLRQSGINIGSEVTTRAGQLGLATREQNLKERQSDIQINAAQESAKALRDYYNSQAPGGQSSSPTSAPVAGGQPPQQPSPAGGVGGGTGSVGGGGGGTGAVVPSNQDTSAAPQSTQPPLTSESDAAFLDKMATAHERAAMAAGLAGGQAAMEAHQKDAQSYRQAAEHARTAGIGTDVTGRSRPLPGAPETAYQLAGAKSKGEAAGKAPYEIKEVAGPNGETYYKSVADIVDENGKAQATPITSSAGAGTPTSGPPQPNLVMAKQPAVMAKRQEAIATNEQKMTESYQVRQIARERYQTLADILSKYQTGKFAENKASMVAALRSVGIPVTDKDTANPAAFEQFTKNAMKNVFSDVHDLGGRILVAEITGLQRSTANPDLQPEANKAILGQAIGLLNYEDQYHDDYFNWKRQNPYAADTSAFDTQWVKAHPVKDFVKAATGNIGALGEQIPAPADRKEGQVYSIPGNKATGTKARPMQWRNGKWFPPPTGNE